MKQGNTIDDIGKAFLCEWDDSPDQYHLKGIYRV